MNFDPFESAKATGQREGFDAGLKQDFTKRGITAFGAAFAGDAVTTAYTNAWLGAFEEALDELRQQGIKVNDPRGKKD